MGRDKPNLANLVGFYNLGKIKAILTKFTICYYPQLFPFVIYYLCVNRCTESGVEEQSFIICDWFLTNMYL